MNALSQEARTLIDSVAVLDGPAAEDKARVRARLAAELGAAAFAKLALSGATQAGLGAGVRDTTTAKATASSLATKLAIAGAVLGIGAGALWLLRGEASQPLEARRAQRSASREQIPQTSAAAAPVASTLSPTRAGDVAANEHEGRPAALPTPQQGARKRGERAAQHELAAPVQAAAESTLSLELPLLREAQAALRAGAPEQALRLATEHQARFPDGVMKEERLGVEALAGCALGRDYRVKAETFLRLAPSSPLAARVQRACGIAR